MQNSRHPTSERPEAERAPAGEWREHEHVNESAIAAAERLLESAGTPEQAKHVIDVAQNMTADHATPHYDLATRAGFTSFLELVSASTRLGNDDPWYVVQLPSGRWLAWNETSLDEVEMDSRSAAEEWTRRQGAGG